MRFLVDECTGPATACWLSQQQYEVFLYMRKHAEWMMKKSFIWFIYIHLFDTHLTHLRLTPANWLRRPRPGYSPAPVGLTLGRVRKMNFLMIFLNRKASIIPVVYSFTTHTTGRLQRLLSGAPAKAANSNRRI